MFLHEVAVDNRDAFSQRIGGRRIEPQQIDEKFHAKVIEQDRPAHAQQIAEELHMPLQR